MMGLCKSGEILGIFHQLDPNFQTLRHEETHPEYLLQGSYHIMVTIVIIMMVYTQGLGHHHHYVGYNGLRIMIAMAMLMMMMILV